MATNTKKLLVQNKLMKYSFIVFSCACVYMILIFLHSSKLIDIFSIHDINDISHTKVDPKLWSQPSDEVNDELQFMINEHKYRTTPTELELVTINSTAIQLNSTDCLAYVSNYAGSQCDRSFSELCVFEASKLTVLIPPKTGRKMWKTILLDLNTSLPSKYHKLISHHWHPPHLKSNKTKNPLDECKNFVTTFFCDVSYRKILVYRDPMTRLLSGYIQQCTAPYNQSCTEYFLSVGTETKYLPRNPRFVHTNFSANNTLNTFIKWLLFSYSENNDSLKFLVNNHFRNFYHFADLSYFHNNWNILSLSDMNTWDYIIKSILINSSLFQYWYDIRRKYFIDGGRKKITKHDTQSSSKVTMYYSDIDTLYLALRYTWKDYYIFNWGLPQWICDILLLNNSKKYVVSDFIRQKFQSKTQLWPSCISVKKTEPLKSKNNQNCVQEYVKIIANIKRWFNYDVIVPIFEKINTMQQQTDGNILEIGVHHGKSFIVMLCFLKRNEIAVAVDQQYNYDNSGKANNRNINKVFKNTDVSISSKINIIKVDSTSLKSNDYLDYVSNDLKYRIISIDGCHQTNATINDLNNAVNIISKDGVIIVDDYFNKEWPCVKAGVDSFLEKCNDYRVFYLDENKFILCHKNYYKMYINVFGNISNNIAIHYESRSWNDQVWKK